MILRIYSLSLRQRNQLFYCLHLTRMCLEVQIDIILYYLEVLVLRGKTNLILRNPNKYYTWLTVNKTLIRRVRITLESALLRRGRGSLGWSIHPISPGMLSNASSSRGLFKNKLCLKVDITSNVLIISTCHLIQSTYPPLRTSNLLIVRLLLIVSQIYCISVLACTVKVLFVFT